MLRKACSLRLLSILRELAGGTPLAVNELARRVRRAPDATSKQLRVLRDARILSLVRPAGEDGRKQIHELPALARLSLLRPRAPP